ncbi:hypothetical protein ARMSODRAFT_1054493 [Armillaria solidipes]|uniref:Uncharacterized protein n=1 Tax=Armillaria solidipes TaxID=1076256 RepID=A0A2H3BE18_9AGAR|nr:hypothetical protein ARMSODRAFT_1054493 [Armillaria solidipes]
MSGPTKKHVHGVGTTASTPSIIRLSHQVPTPCSATLKLPLGRDCGDDILVQRPPHSLRIPLWNCSLSQAAERERSWFMFSSSNQRSKASPQNYTFIPLLPVDDAVRVPSLVPDMSDACTLRTLFSLRASIGILHGSMDIGFNRKGSWYSCFLPSSVPSPSNSLATVSRKYKVIIAPDVANCQSPFGRLQVPICLLRDINIAQVLSPTTVPALNACLKVAEIAEASGVPYVENVAKVAVVVFKLLETKAKNKESVKEL